MTIQPKIFLISITICASIAGSVSYFSQMNFWQIFPIVVGAVFINGLIANWEERQLGGFENPQQKDKEKPPEQ